MEVKARLQKAMKKESGIRLSAAEVHALAAMMGMGIGGTATAKQSSAIKRPAKVERGEPAKVLIRWMIRRDMPAVLDIESQCFDTAWSEEEFIRCLRQWNCIGMVAELFEQVVGFMIYELRKNRLHILNFAVAKEMQNCTVGKQMLEKLLGKLSSDRRNRIMLEVRESNLRAQQFFRSQGFKAISILKDFYDNSREDAYLMQLMHNGEKSDFVRQPESTKSEPEWKDSYTDRDDDGDCLSE